jgi:hypothetical protein
MGVWMFPPVAAGGSTVSVDIASTRPRATGDDNDNARAEELNNLRLALATFALQLDAFELRTSNEWRTVQGRHEPRNACSAA